MANNSNVFPAIIKAEYQGSNAFPALVADADKASQAMARKFDQQFGQIQKAVEGSLGRAATSAGALDLGTKQANEAAQAAQRRADALREVARAARAAADAERNVPSLSLQAKAAAAAAVEARQFARDAAQQALALDRLQVELDQASASTRRFTQAQSASTGQTAAGRQAYQNLGFQISDISQSLALGISPFVVFGQQAGQTAAAVSGMGGVLGRVGGFLAGPFGSLILGAVTVVGLLGSKMFETADATDDAGKAADDFATRQLDLGNFIDKTTGKLIEQNATLRENAILLRQGEISKKQNAILDRRETAFDIASRAAGSGVQQSLTGREGITVAQKPNSAISGAIQRANGNAFALKRELEALNNPKLKGVIQQIGQLNAQSILTARDIKRLGLENVAIGGGKVDRSLLDLKKQRGSRGPKGPSAETLAKREFALQEFGQDAGDKIAAIRDRFGDSPSLLQKQAAALRELADIQTDLEQKKPPELDKYLAQLTEAKGIVQNSLNKPFKEMLETAREQSAIEGLILEGREFEAEVLARTLTLMDQQGSITTAQVEDIAKIVAGEKARSFEIERQRELQQRNLAALEATQENLRTAVREIFDGKGFGAIGNLISNQFDTYVQALTDDISESLFGDVFREQKLKLLGLDKVDEAGKEMAAEIAETAKKLDALKKAATDAAVALGNVAANDNPIGSAVPATDSEIVVTATKSIGKTISDALKGALNKALGDKLANSIVEGIKVVAQGAAIGQASSGFVKSLGLKQSKLGSQIGGAIGNVIAGPLGAIAGGIIGGTIGGLFKKTPKGSATISSVVDDVSYSGSGKLRESVTGLGSNVRASLSNIIEQLGGTAGAFSVSIGQRGKNFVVDPTGQGRTKGSGVLKFKDEAEAQRAALLDAIRDGAVQGIKEGAQRLLQAGKDLDAQLLKAVKFQNVFDRLEAIKNPLGAAVGALNREFTGLISIFREAGASAEDFAKLEELYGLERAKIIKEQSETLTNSLRGLIDDLTKGDSGLSLRDRLSNIRADFDPLVATIRAGGTVDFDKFSELSRQLIEVQRQISGSQPDYFATFNEVLGLSRQALAGQENVISLGSGSSSPFSGNAAPSNASTPVVSAIAAQTTDLSAILNAINANIGNLGRNTATITAPSTRYAVGGATYF